MARLTKFVDEINQNSRKRHLLFIALTLVTVFINGYHYGTFDQVFHIPFLKSLADPQLFPGDPQPRFQCVGGIQHAADRALAALSALAGSPRQPCDDGEGGGQQGGQDEVHAGSLRERRPRGKPGAGAARADRCIALI